jgi:hypothetical protein
MAQHVAQQPLQKGHHVHGSEVGRLAADIQSHVLALWRHREEGQGRVERELRVLHDLCPISCTRPNVNGPTKGRWLRQVVDQVTAVPQQLGRYY